MRVFALAVLGSLMACTSKPDADAVTLRALERPAFTEAELPDDASAHVGQAIVVDFRDGTTKAEFDALETGWGVDLELVDQEEGKDSAITVARGVTDVDAVLAKIRGNSQVEVAEPLMAYQASFVPNDPGYAKQWNLEQIHMPKAWERSKGKGVVVAVLDTGIAYEDYQGFRRVPDLAQTQFVPGYDFVADDDHPNDDHGHGTHVAGTIAQSTNNGEGVAGVAFEAKLMPVKVLDAGGGGTSAAIADAIRWAADHGAQVINMSLGGGGHSQVLANAVGYARKKGVVVVAAAGNAGRGVVEFPAAYPGAVAVAAVGPSGSRAPYSSWGKELDIAAPGGDKSLGIEAGIIQNTIDPSDVSQSVYASYQGTSMATPHVAGVAALLWAAGAKSPDQVEKAIFASAHPPQGTQGWTDQFGHGVIDAEAALKALKQVKADGDFTPVFVPEISAASEADGPMHASAAHDVDAMLAWPTLDFGPFAIAAALLALALLTLGRRERPGYLNALLKPAFALPLVVTTLGVFAVRWVLSPSDMGASIVLPLPEWLQKIIFGRGSLANPLVYSAAVPIVLSLFAIKLEGMRPVVAGVALGFAGILGYTVWAKAPALAWLPFTFLAIPWLVVNALVCVVIARALLRKAS